MNFSRFLTVQSWWEVPCIAYFCSLFRTAFNLLDFDIEELEEALLTDGTEESASSLLTELIVRLLNGCLGNNDISAFNYQMYLRRLFRQKCQETSRYNPFNTDIDFQFLPLRTKVEILYALCDFRLDAADVLDLFKNLEAESLRVEPLGYDDNDSAFWYFYGTRLYREDIIKKPKSKGTKKKKKENRKRGWFYGDDWLDDEDVQRIWQVVCFSEEDWAHLTERFSKATSKVEKELYRSLSQNFLPEIPRLFQEKERLQRKRLLEHAPRRTSNRVLQKIKQKKEQLQEKKAQDAGLGNRKETPDLARENRAKRRNLLRSKSTSSDSSDSSDSEKEEMPLKVSKRSKGQEKRSKNSSATQKGEPPPAEPVVKTGRKTNNSLASATGQIVIPDSDEPNTNSTRKKLKTSQIFSQTEEDIQTDMYKVLEQLLAHEDAWPFLDPVEEEYAPNYYAVIRRPMDLHKMEERLDSGYYTDFSMFKADFKLIVNNCRLYNGQDNEYTIMVDNLQAAFDRLTEKYISRYSSSDEEIAVEYQIPTPSRKHKRKASESPPRHKRKKTKSQSEPEPGSSTSDHVQDEKHDKEKEMEEEKEQEKEQEKEKEEEEESVEKAKKSKEKESHKSKDEKGKSKKKRRGHHRHGKHSKNRNKKEEKHRSDRHGDSKNKHGKKDKHSKKKDGKRSKKKKNKHQEVETVLPEELKRSESQESLESSNRSRSASPLPSIHTPSPSRSPSPVDLGPPPDSDPDPEPYKDKFDMIKERRRHSAKDAWESLFENKQKAPEKHKHHASGPEKDKHQKLRETIEKLKAKNQKYKDASLFNTLFSPGHSSSDKKAEAGTSKSSTNKDIRENDFSSDDGEEIKETTKKSVSKKGSKKNSAKNESASEALEQAVKDISKWLDDAPKGSAGSSPCDSPAQTISTEEQDNSRLDDEFVQGEKPLLSKKEVSRKRPSSREPKLVKRREIQRTIDRLQPGKSKGNLLTNKANKNVEKTQEEVTPTGPQYKTRDLNKVEESSPKLSLGSVLPTVKFTLGNDHNFSNDEKKSEPDKKYTISVDAKKEGKKVVVPKEKKYNAVSTPVTKKDVEVETEPQSPTKPSQEKATPNLSAWFKAFGAPKTPSVTAVKKKTEDVPDTEDKPVELTPTNDNKTASPKNQPKYDSPTDPGTPNPDGGDSPLLNVSNTPRQRRTSTGSSVSERSSFSQDLDSPRHQMSHTSPLIQSPASPRTDDFQKITYPIINGTVRAGFYQDTTSMKSSPEKSCSPREAPQSPYSPFSPHVYASNNVMGSSTPNYFVDHNKSPLPTYTQNPPTFYDSSKAPVVSKPSLAQDNYTALGPNIYPQNPYSSSQYSPAHSPYPQPPSVHSPQPVASSASPTTIQQTADAKALFPVKKRIYNEPEVHTNNVPEVKETVPVAKNEYQRPNQSLHPGVSTSTTSVDDIALALSEKSEIAKLSGLRDKNKMEYSEQRTLDIRETQMFDRNDRVENTKKECTSADTNKLMELKRDNVDMVNMGYMNPDYDKRLALENHMHDIHYANSREVLKSSLQHKGYEIDAIAINLGINNQHMQKNANKISSNTSGMPIPHAHSHERHTELTINHNIPHAHHNQYENITSGQTISNFSLNDIELANKKLYACNPNTSTAALDYGNWKMTNQLRKPDLMPSDYSSSYNSNNAEKLKMDTNVANTAAINYNKNLHQQQYNTYNNPPRPMLRAHDLQQNLPAELRIPNPRGLLKNDHLTATSSLNESEMMAKNIDVAVKSQKSDKMTQNHPMVGSMTYKTPYGSHSSIPLDSLRSLQNLPQMLERYTNDERYLSSFTSSASSLYHDKTFQMAQMFNKNLQSEVHPTSTSSNIYSQPSTVLSKDTSIYKNAAMTTSQSDPKTPAKNKRKRATETKPQVSATQAHFGATSGSDVLSSVKSNMMSSSAFNFGTSTNIGLGGAIYGDNSGFTIEDFRNSTNQIMAANYMAAVAHQQQQQQRSSADPGVDKLAKPAHQNSTGAFSFLGAGQVRAGYGFADPSSPLYQQYFQRHQEELLRQTGAQIMSLYPPGYPPGLGTRQPYDSINRHSWL